MKFLGLFFSLTIFFSLLIFPIGIEAKTVSKPLPVAAASPSPTPKPIDVYDAFYPITPGKVMGDSLYFLKSIKESLRGILVFGNYNKSEYNLTLAEKRLVEANYLFSVKKDFENAEASIIAAKLKMEKAVESAKNAEDLPDIATLKSKISNSADKQRHLINYLITQVGKDESQELEDYENYLSSLLSNPQ